MVDISQLEAQMRQMEQKLRSEGAKRVREAEALRHRTAEAALQWVAAQRERIEAFRKHVRGTPVEGLVDKVLSQIPSPASAHPAPAASRASKRRKPAAKTARKQAPAGATTSARGTSARKPRKSAGSRRTS